MSDDSTSRGLARSSSVVGGAVLVSRVLGLVREQVFAALFGAGRELDAFVAAFRIPNLFRDLFAEGALSAAFVTTFSQQMQREGRAAAWQLANRVLHVLLLVVGGLVLLGMWAAPGIVDLMAPGFREIAGKTELTIRLTRIMFPFLLLVALAAVAMGMLNTCGRFGVPASASSFFNLGSILGGLGAAAWLAPGFVARGFGEVGTPLPPGEVERAIIGMALGTLLGGLLQLLVQIPSLRRVGYRYEPILSFRDRGVRQVLALMAPATIGAAAVQINVLVNTNFASALGDGAVSWLNVAFRFMQLPIGLFGVAVGVVALPAVSRHAARDDLTSFNQTLVRALRLVLGLCLPAAAGLALLAPELIGLVYEHGRFTPHDTAQAAAALAAYALGLVGYANIKVLVPAYYALGDARTPAWVSCLSILVNAAGAWATIRWLGLGHTGLALMTAVVATANFAVLFAILRRRLGRFRGLAGATLRIAAATSGVAVVCLAVKAGVAVLLAPGFTARAVTVALAVPGGALLFAALGARLGLEEAEILTRRVFRRVRPS